MFGIPWTTILLAAFMAYMAYTAYILYSLFKPPVCASTKGSACLRPWVETKPKLSLQVCTSLQPHLSGSSKVVWDYKNFSLEETVERTFNVNIPASTRNNGSLYVRLLLFPRGQKPETSYISFDVSKITTWAVPKASFINLLGGQDEQEAANQTRAKTKTRKSSNSPFTHFRQRLSVSVMGDELAFDKKELPNELHALIRSTRDEKFYMPIAYIDELGYRMRDLLLLNSSSDMVPLTITYTPISVGKLRMWINIQQSFRMLQTLGFSEKDIDEVKGIFADTNLYFLMLTFGVAAFHLLFDFLAFKNEISYWRQRKTMVGLSTRVVVWRCVSTGIIFLYLMDQETSLLVLVPAGIGTLIEMWKVTKALKVTLHWTGRIPKLEIGASSDQEKQTEEFDSQAMKFLSYFLYPLCLAGAIYSLFYVQHKSWYSWCVNSLVNGVYAFGFLFMLPQLFVNYKLKSVAHLPWRAFMYKAFNTFIDDVFAFIITMPTAHRLACFRDDIVFMVYLYQRWLYPVDKKRANEFGVSYEDEGGEGTVEAKKTK